MMNTSRAEQHVCRKNTPTARAVFVLKSRTGCQYTEPRAVSLGHVRSENRWSDDRPGRDSSGPTLFLWSVGPLWRGWADSVIVFYFYTIIYSKVVLNLSEFLSSAECKCYFEEQGNSNSCWSSVTSIFFLLSKSMWTSNCLLTQTHQNILFCVQHKKEINTGLVQHESE